MATSPRRFTAHPATATRAYRPRERRGTATERGYQGDRGAWKRIVQQAKRDPDKALCDWCRLLEGRDVPLQVVDHVIPHHGHGDPLLLDYTNTRGLCHRHHQQKTARQDDQIRAEYDTLRGQGKSHEEARDTVVPKWRERAA